ncbi:MAG: OmpA family protein [Pseudomonadota bacterium]
MTLFLRQWLVLCVGLCPAGSVLAGSQYYGAALHESRWEVKSTRMACTLSHTIPLYGTVRFEGRAGGGLDFTVQVLRRPAKAGVAQLASLAPAWKHDTPALALGQVSVADSAEPIRFDRPLARRLLAELEKGMFPTFTYQDWADGRDEVTVAISAVNVKSALGEFLGCLDGLLSYDFSAVQKTLVNFAFGSAALGPEARRVLDRVAEYLLADPAVSGVLIEGHTDNVGFRRYNERLSRQRSEAVRDYLVKKGIAREKFTLRSQGEAKPLASNRTDSGRAVNRRVIVLLTQ